MRGFNLIGVLLLVMGIALVATTGNSFEERKEALQTQNVELPLKDRHRENWPWLAGTVAVVGGLVLFVRKANKAAVKEKESPAADAVDHSENR